MPLDEASAMVGWVAQCGACSGNLWVRDAALIRDAVCEECELLGSTVEGGMIDVTDQLVATQLGWCGCGSTWRLDGMMLAYLRSLDNDTFPRPAPEGVSDDAVMLLANIADHASWTEHGTTVDGAWLTDIGRQVIDRLAATAAVHLTFVGFRSCHQNTRWP